MASKSKEGIICASISAWGTRGPWKTRRGFDSIVQTASGIFASEAEHRGRGDVCQPLPTQVLDYASSFFLATGIMAAMYKQATVDGSFTVDVSLAGAMKYLRSLGQYHRTSGFDCPKLGLEDIKDDHFETRSCGLGTLRPVKHAATIQGVNMGWDIMPKPLGSDKAEWLPRSPAYEEKGMPNHSIGEARSKM